MDSCDFCKKPVGGVEPRPVFVFHIWCSKECAEQYEKKNKENELGLVSKP